METEHIRPFVVRQHIHALDCWKKHISNYIAFEFHSSGTYIGGDEELNQDEQWKYSGVVVACTMASSKPSETALRGCCKVCAKPEEEDKRFLVCDHSLCMYKYYHIRCMRPGQIANTHQITRRWYCPSCLCRRCFCDVDDSKIVMCDGCDEAYHTYCMRPSRATVPKGDWYCKSCTKARELEQQARELEEKVAQDEEMILKIHRRLNAPLVRSYRYDALNLLAAAAKQREEEDAAEELKRKEAAEKMDVDVATVAE